MARCVACKTDYIDLYWLHAWDTVTPVEEVVSTLNDLGREKARFATTDSPTLPRGTSRVRYTLAEKEGKERLIALQLEYSLVERNIEREHIPAAQELGLGICPWSPLASGFLTGKYKRKETDSQGTAAWRKPKTPQIPPSLRFNEKNWEILDVLLEISKADRPSARRTSP